MKNINKKILFVTLILSFIIILAIIIPIISPYRFDEQLRGEELQEPSINHLLGTDYLGRDLFVRLMYATRISLLVGISTSLINIIIGTIYGSISGICGGKIDWIMMRILDILMSIPQIIYVIFIVMLCQNLFLDKFGDNKDIINILIAMGTTCWFKMARTIRAEVIHIKNQEYFTYSTAIGSKKWYLLLKHIIPNSLHTIVIITILQIPTAIFTESFLSFIGIGINAPIPSWGSLIYEGTGMLYSQPQTIIYTSILVITIMLLITILTESLRKKITSEEIQ